MEPRGIIPLSMWGKETPVVYENRSYSLTKSVEILGRVVSISQISWEQTFFWSLARILYSEVRTLLTPKISRHKTLLELCECGYVLSFFQKVQKSHWMKNIFSKNRKFLPGNAWMPASKSVAFLTFFFPLNTPSHGQSKADNFYVDVFQATKRF